MQAVRARTHDMLNRVHRDFERFQFNTVVAACMELTNHLEKVDWSARGAAGGAVLREAVTIALVRDSVVMVVQVNGKRRAEIEMPSGAAEESVREAALDNAQVQRHTEGKTVRKCIVVPDKLVNLVVG